MSESRPGRHECLRTVTTAEDVKSFLRAPLGVFCFLVGHASACPARSARPFGLAILTTRRAEARFTTWRRRAVSVEPPEAG